jgi:hypothetical protein
MSELAVGIIVATFTVVLAAILAFIVRVNSRQAEMALALAKLEVQVSPMWATVQARMSSDLHHPHPRYLEMDVLLEKLEALTITPAERDRLKELLVVRSVDIHKDITDSQRKSAVAMIPLMDLVVLEAEETKNIAKGILPK